MLFAILTLLCALSVSAIAAYYSVIGLIAIFSAAPIPIAVMGGTLEAAKLVVASWVYKNWNVAPKLLKYYFVTAIVVLMFITSLGIFGFLSKAHSDQSLATGDAIAKLEIIDDKIRVAKETIDGNRKILKQLDESVDQIMARSTSEEGARRANALRVSQKAERNRIANENEAQQKVIAKLNEDRQPFATEVRKVESEVGPLKYIAAMIYEDQVTQTMLEQAVRWVIILIVLVFDPLAVLLVIAGNFSLRQAREERENLEPILPFVADVGEKPTKEELQEIEETEYEIKEKIDLTTMEPVPMNKEEIEKATTVRHTQKYPLEK
jgi:hypothetical protein